MKSYLQMFGSKSEHSVSCSKFLLCERFKDYSLFTYLTGREGFVRRQPVDVLRDDVTRKLRIQQLTDIKAKKTWILQNILALYQNRFEGSEINCQVFNREMSILVCMTAVAA